MKGGSCTVTILLFGHRQADITVLKANILLLYHLYLSTYKFLLVPDMYVLCKSKTGQYPNQK